MNDDDQARTKEVRAFRALLDDMRVKWPMRLELIAMQAKTAKARYDALRREGFEVSEALQLCVRQWEQ